MWLASLMIGYSLILWKLFSPAIVLVRMRRDDPNWRETLQITPASIVANLFGLVFLLLFSLCTLVGSTTSIPSSSIASTRFRLVRIANP